MMTSETFFLPSREHRGCIGLHFLPNLVMRRPAPMDEKLHVVSTFLTCPVSRTFPLVIVKCTFKNTPPSALSFMKQQLQSQGRCQLASNLGRKCLYYLHVSFFPYWGPFLPLSAKGTVKMTVLGTFSILGSLRIQLAPQLRPWKINMSPTFHELLIEDFFHFCQPLVITSPSAQPLVDRGDTTRKVLFTGKSTLSTRFIYSIFRTSSPSINLVHHTGDSWHTTPTPVHPFVEQSQSQVRCFLRVLFRKSIHIFCILRALYWGIFPNFIVIGYNSSFTSNSRGQATSPRAMLLAQCSWHQNSHGANLLHIHDFSRALYPPLSTGSISTTFRPLGNHVMN